MPVPAEATPQPGQRFLMLPSASSPLECDDIQEPNFFLRFDFLCSFIRPQIVSSAFFTLLKKKIIDGHFDTLLHFCSPGTFGKNKFLLR